jgi:hypothetical protein
VEEAEEKERGVTRKTPSNIGKPTSRSAAQIAEACRLHKIITSPNIWIDDRGGRKRYIRVY